MDCANLRSVSKVCPLDGKGATLLHAWTVFTTRMPKRKDFQFGPAHSVVQEVLCSAEQESAYLRRSASLYLRADVRLLDEEFQGVLGVFAYCARSSKATLGPPCSCVLDLAPGAGRR